MRLRETESSSYESGPVLDQVAVQTEENKLPEIYKIGSKCWGPTKIDKRAVTKELIPYCTVIGLEDDGQKVTAVKISYDNDGSFKTISVKQFKELQIEGSKQTL